MISQICPGYSRRECRTFETIIRRLHIILRRWRNLRFVLAEIKRGVTSFVRVTGCRCVPDYFGSTDAPEHKAICRSHSRSGSIALPQSTFSACWNSSTASHGVVRFSRCKMRAPMHGKIGMQSSAPGSTRYTFAKMASFLKFSASASRTIDSPSWAPTGGSSGN